MATKSTATTKSSIYDEFETTSTKTLKKITEVEDSELNFGRSDRLELKDGTNKIRFWPKRKGEESFFKMRGSQWYKLPDENATKDGEEITRVVPNARIVGIMEQDVSEVYMEFVRENLDGSDPIDGRKIKKVLGSGYNGGLQPNITWVAYASHVKDGKAGKPEQFDFKKTVRDALNAEMIVEDEDEAIETDPFTHPKDGRYVQITYNPKAKKNTDYYKVRVSDNKCPLTTEQLQEFAKMTPLPMLEIFQYTIEDFETAVKGIEYYDEENEIGLFEKKEFQALLKEYRKELITKLKADDKVADDSDLPFTEEDTDDEATDDEKPTKKAKAKPTKKQKPESEEEEEVIEEDEETTEEETSDDEPDEFEAMDRDELKQYKVDNELDFKVLKSDSDDDLRNKIRQAVAAKNEETVEEEEEKPTPKPAKKEGGKLTLDDIKNKLKTKGK